MIPSKITIQDLFASTRQYVVPLYQRSYVWTREGQWEPLWEDIEAKASKIAAGEQPPPHFLGAAVLNQISTFGNEISKRQVIDGQQRLTTLQIFLVALRDHILHAKNAATDEELTDRLQSLLEGVRPLTENIGPMANRKVERHKVWPTNFDRDVFVQVVTAEGLEEVNRRFPLTKLPKKRTPEPGPRLVECYRYFAQQIRDFAASPGAGPHPLEMLYQTIKQCLQLVVIELENDDDPQVIFETLNARGMPLLPSDLIRNHLFGRANGQGHDIDALYNEQWRHYDELNADGTPGFWKQDMKQGRSLRPRFDIFFQHYLTCRLESEVSPAHVFQPFRAWWAAARPERDVRAELVTLHRFSDGFRDFIEPDRIAAADPTLARFLRHFRVLDTSTAFPLLLFLLVEARERIAREERDRILVDLESFLVRSWICARPAKNYNKIFTALLKDSRGVSPLDHRLIRARLLAISGDAAWPDDPQFERAWMSEQVYTRLGSSGVQMVLGAIHDQMLTARQERVSIAGPLTVEHVMPQVWRTHWPPPAPAPTVTPGDPTPEERRDELLHTFGNLTLLTQKLNSDVSNGPYPAKREEILGQGLLRLHAYFRNVEVWDEANILIRGRALFAHAARLWPYPARP